MYEQEQYPPWCPLKSKVQSNLPIKSPNSTKRPNYKKRFPKPFRAPPCPNGFLYTVKRGDTLSRLALRYDLTFQDLITANPGITNPNLLPLGQEVCIPLPIPQISCPTGVLHMVRKGENLVSIAEKYNLTLEELLEANPEIKNPDLFFPGQMICIPNG